MAGGPHGDGAAHRGTGWDTLQPILIYLYHPFCQTAEESSTGYDTNNAKRSVAANPFKMHVS